MTLKLFRSVFPVFALAAVCAMLLFAFFPPTAAQAQGFPNVYTAAYTTQFDLSDGAGATLVVNAPPAALGDFCVASLPVDAVDMIVSCYVQAAGKIEIRVQNESGSSSDLAPGTARAILFPRGTR